MVTKDLAGKFNAGDIVKEIAPIVGGSGGGLPALRRLPGKNHAQDSRFYRGTAISAKSASIGQRTLNAFVQPN